MNISQNKSYSETGYGESKTEAWSPDLDHLHNVLSEVLLNRGLNTRDLTIVDRRPDVRTHTSPTEIVKCKLGDGQELHLFCKYGTNQPYDDYGERSGVKRESEVYRHLLVPLHVTVPTYYGSYDDEEHGRTWLITEWLDNGVRLNESAEKITLELTAQWIGKFHSASEPQVPSGKLSFLPRYDADYYRGWAEKAILYSRESWAQLQWMDRLLPRFETVMVLLLKSKLTVIHGDYHLNNILIDKGMVRPVDWESAAIAIGEIDLAQLTDNLSEEAVQQIKNAYREARWGASPDPGLDLRFNVARMYLQFRLLGEQKGVRPVGEYTIRRFNKLRAIGRQLGLIE